jgi:hypothetical protein
VKGVMTPGRVLDRLVVRGARGVALPLSLLGLLILSTLIIAFATLASTEPVIAANQLRAAQARAAAEAGVERTAWALAHAAEVGGLAEPLPEPIPAPYDGSTLVDVSVNGAVVGGFRVIVGPGGGPAERTVTSTGWAPSDTAAGKARQRIVATLVRLRFPEPPAALTAGGPLQITGPAGVDARQDLSCGGKVGAWSPGAITAQAPAAVWGADGNSTPNQATDLAAHAPRPDLDRHALGEGDLATMRAYARAHGTYYQGRVVFGPDQPVPNGLVFVDTVSGGPVSDSTPDADLASVVILGSAAADPSGIARGWIVVNGSLEISGSFQMVGFVYAQNDLSYAGSDGSQITGAVMGRNVRATSATRVTAGPGGGLIRYDCQQARTGGGAIPQSWTVKRGTYREIPG